MGMKGVVFTEFMELVENQFGLGVADQMVQAAEVHGGGAYTAVGTYDHRELAAMAGWLSEETQIDQAKLLREFGAHLLERFSVNYPHLFAKVGSAFELLLGVDELIHAEVRKLYADAELPHVNATLESEDVLIVEYRSTRPFADLAEGLIRACGGLFGEDIDVRRESIDGAGPCAARFRLTRQGNDS